MSIPLMQAAKQRSVLLKALDSDLLASHLQWNAPEPSLANDDEVLPGRTVLSDLDREVGWRGGDAARVVGPSHQVRSAGVACYVKNIESPLVALHAELSPSLSCRLGFEEPLSDETPEQESGGRDRGSNVGRVRLYRGCGRGSLRELAELFRCASR